MTQILPSDPSLDPNLSSAPTPPARSRSILPALALTSFVLAFYHGGCNLLIAPTTLALYQQRTARPMLETPTVEWQPIDLRATPCPGEFVRNRGLSAAERQKVIDYIRSQPSETSRRPRATSDNRPFETPELQLHSILSEVDRLDFEPSALRFTVRPLYLGGLRVGIDAWSCRSGDTQLTLRQSVLSTYRNNKGEELVARELVFSRNSMSIDTSIGNYRLSAATISRFLDEVRSRAGNLTPLQAGLLAEALSKWRQPGKAPTNRAMEPDSCPVVEVKPGNVLEITEPAGDRWRIDSMGACWFRDGERQGRLAAYREQHGPPGVSGPAAALLVADAFLNIPLAGLLLLVAILLAAEVPLAAPLLYLWSILKLCLGLLFLGAGLWASLTVTNAANGASHWGYQSTSVQVTSIILATIVGSMFPLIAISLLRQGSVATALRSRRPPAPLATHG